MCPEVQLCDMSIDVGWVKRGELTPPDVGAELASSAILAPIQRINALATSQPQTMATGPPFGIAYIWTV